LLIGGSLKGSPSFTVPEVRLSKHRGKHDAHSFDIKERHDMRKIRRFCRGNLKANGCRAAQKKNTESDSFCCVPV
jgi:hypothetical protein